MIMQPMPQLDLDILIRFWSKINRASVDECWNWLAGKATKGYGVLNVDGHTFIASRLAYYIEFKIDPGHLFVCHDCNNPPCCNPNHLYLGTNSENLIDACRDGLKPMSGILSSRAKLNDENIRQIRRLHSVKTPLELATQFGVSRSTIYSILNYENWSHIQ